MKKLVPKLFRLFGVSATNLMTVEQLNEIYLSANARIFFAVILTLTVILGLLFINVTSRTLYTNTWKQLQSYSDSLIEDSMRYDTATKQFEGFTTVPLENNARLLQRQNVHFTIYSTKDELIYSSSNYSAKITSADWKKN